MADHMREQLEDMMSSQGEWPQAIEKDSRGSYKFATAATAWETWQSAWEAGQEMMKSRIKELEAENAGLRKFIEAKMHHLPIEDQHVASVMIQQSDDEGEA